MTTKSAQILVIAPHPDDAEFGAGGTIARWAQEGKSIVYVVCTNGDKGTSDPKITPAKLAKIREKEHRAAAKVLGVIKQRCKTQAEGTGCELADAFYRFELSY
ncbi:MAG: PIG-L family deacetylase [Dehalococcoidales bacterium]|nr:PIG-L family deacetylase [Dehalococcoidales bacterium]